MVMTIQERVVNLLIEKNISITAAESLTAGEFQSTLGQVPGVSSVFEGGFVTYSNEVKEQLLGIPKDVIDTFGVVSGETAVWMANQARSILRKDIGISFTGAAGPDSLEGKPAGTVFIGIALPGDKTYSREYHFDGSRNEIRTHCVEQGLKLVLAEIEK